MGSCEAWETCLERFVASEDCLGGSSGSRDRLRGLRRLSWGGLGVEWLGLGFENESTGFWFRQSDLFGGLVCKNAILGGLAVEKVRRMRFGSLRTKLVGSHFIFNTGDPFSRKNRLPTGSVRSLFLK